VRVISSTWVEICAYGTAVIAVRSRPAELRFHRAVRSHRGLEPASPVPALYETTMVAKGHR
jgi:hypothetical protein